MGKFWNYLKKHSEDCLKIRKISKKKYLENCKKKKLENLKQKNCKNRKIVEKL